MTEVSWMVSFRAYAVSNSVRKSRTAARLNELGRSGYCVPDGLESDRTGGRTTSEAAHAGVPCDVVFVGVSSEMDEPTEVSPVEGDSGIEQPASVADVRILISHLRSTILYKNIIAK